MSNPQLSGGPAINKMQEIKGKEIGKPMKSPLTQEVTATTCTLQNLIYNAIKNPVIQQKLVKYLKDNPKRIPVRVVQLAHVSAAVYKLQE